MRNWKEVSEKLWVKYRHFVPVLLYLVFYLAVFAYVENRPNHNLHLLSSAYDKMIPFCEVFVVPYLLWFVYITVTVLYFGMIEKNKTEFYELITNLSIGMTLFLIISLLWPNGHTLRPITFSRSNIFIELVKEVYRTDTSTNIFPSIHVYNSVAAHIAIARCQSLKKHPIVTKGSLILCISIVAATLFIKQHTIIDVIGALFINFAAYCAIYLPQTELHRRHARSRVRQLSQKNRDHRIM
ncbi:MAG: phosphoesterase [Eubacteriales bacterium]|nr:phosphoesterase [Eubacteriales bacterium]